MVKEVRQLRRDRITLAMILGIPVFQLILFGYAINLNLRGLAAGIADEANSSASRALVMDMVASGVIKPRLAATSPQQLTDALRAGRISIGVVIPPDFEARRFDGREAVQVLVDGSDTVVQSAAISPVGATIAEPPIIGTPASLPAFATPTTHMPFWYAPDCITRWLWKSPNRSWSGAGGLWTGVL